MFLRRGILELKEEGGEFLIFLMAMSNPQMILFLEVATVWNLAKKGIKNHFIFTLMNSSINLFQKIEPAPMVLV